MWEGGGGEAVNEMKEEEEGKRRRNEGPNSEMKLIQRSRDREQCKRISGHNNFSALVVIFNLQHQNSPTIDFSSGKHFLAYFVFRYIITVRCEQVVLLHPT